MLERTEDSPLAPEFDVVLRGYDRAQVEVYIDRLRDWVAEERGRFETAKEQYAAAWFENTELRDRVASLERQVEKQETPSFVELGEEAAGLFQKAGETAEELLRKARAQADTTVAEAEAKAAESRGTAMRDSTELTNQARRELQEARETSARLRAETEAAVDSLRAEAAAEVEALRSETKAQADDRVQDAKDEAVRIVIEAEEVRRATLSRLEAQRAEIQQDIQRLAVRREGILIELDQLAASLDQMTSLSRAQVVAGLFAPHGAAHHSGD